MTLNVYFINNLQKKYSIFLCSARHLDPPKSPLKRATFLVPPLLRGVRGDKNYPSSDARVL
jgi:hypothetical protein